MNLRLAGRRQGRAERGASWRRCQSLPRREALAPGQPNPPDSPTGGSQGPSSNHCSNSQGSNSINGSSLNSIIGSSLTRPTQSGKRGPSPGPVGSGAVLVAAGWMCAGTTQAPGQARRLHPPHHEERAQQAAEVQRQVCGSLGHVLHPHLLPAANKTEWIGLCWAVAPMATGYLPLPWAAACPLSCQAARLY